MSYKNLHIFRKEVFSVDSARKQELMRAALMGVVGGLIGGAIRYWLSGRLDYDEIYADGFNDGYDLGYVDNETGLPYEGDDPKLIACYGKEAKRIKRAAEAATMTSCHCGGGGSCQAHHQDTQSDHNINAIAEVAAKMVAEQMLKAKQEDAAAHAQPSSSPDIENDSSGDDLSAYEGAS